MEEFSYIGKWWLPGASEAPVYGTVSYAREAGLLLEGVATAEDMAPRREVPLIFGVTGAGREVTLVGCFPYGWTNGVVRNFRSRAEIAVLGMHLNEPEQGFRRVNIGYTRLREWIAIPYFDPLEAHGQPGIMRFQFNFPSPIEGNVRGGELTLKHTLYMEGGDNSPLHLTPRASLDVVSESELTLSQWRQKFVLPFQHFLTLATGQPTGITDFRAYVGAAQEEDGTPPVDVIMPSVAQGENAADVSNKFNRDSLFTLPPIRERWQEIIAGWFTLADDLGPTMDMFFAVTYTKFMYVEHQLLTLVQVAESFSRVRRKLEPPLNVSEFEAKKAEALGKLSPELREWIGPRITPYIGSPSLRVRLEDLVTYTIPVLGQLIPSAPAFATEVVDMRNLLEHKSHKRIIERHEISRILAMVFRLKAILRSSFLLEIGIPAAQAAKFYENNLRFQQIP